MKLVIDMNLSPEWVAVLQCHGWEAVHWSSVGNPRAPDAEMMAWAKTSAYMVFTHDLDFGAILAATDAQNNERPRSKLRENLPVKDRIIARRRGDSVAQLASCMRRPHTGLAMTLNPN